MKGKTVATLYLAVGTPAEYTADFLRDLSGARGGDSLSASLSTLPPGVTVSSSGMAGTPEDMSNGPYELVFQDDYNNESAVLDIEEGAPTVPPQHVDLTESVTELDAGTPYVVDVLAAGPSQAAMATVDGTLPTGMTLGQNGATIEGIPGDPGDYPIQVDYGDMFDEPLPGSVSTVLAVTASVVTIPAPAAEGTEDGYMLPDVEGVIWTVDDVETLPGTYSVKPVTETTTVRILPSPDVGFAFEDEPEALVLVFEPDPDPDPDPAPEDWSHLLDDDPEAVHVGEVLAARVLTHVGDAGDDLELAQAHVHVILEYVKGYTRDKGFHGYIPERALQAVIVAAAARLYVNPEQLSYYSTGDYSERPATMSGWTAAELGVLRRYRKVWA